MPEQAETQAAVPDGGPPPGGGQAVYAERLAAALERKAAQLTAQLLPQLQESFRLYLPLFANLCEVLQRKSLIQEDPYHYDGEVSELRVPPQGPIALSEKGEALSRRLSEYRGQLQFVNDSCRFELEFLNLERLKRIAGLARYIDWANLISASSDSTTSALAETLGRIKLGTDKVSAGIVTDASHQLAALSRQILEQLKEVVVWQREAYKLELRRRLFRRLERGLNKVLEEGVEEAATKLQRVFAKFLPDRAFYRDLVQEALREDYTEESARLQAEALAHLAVQEAKPRAPAADTRELLLEAVRLMVPARVFLEDALAKLEANWKQASEPRRGVGGWLRSLFGARRPASPAALEIRQVDRTTGVTRSSRLDFPDFASRVRRKTALLAELASAGSPLTTRLRAAPEKDILSFLTRNLSELSLFLRVMAGLDAHFKSGGGPVKGIKIELAAVKNSLVRANKRRWEYASRVEPSSG